jgi:hypothetical protein
LVTDDGQDTLTLKWQEVWWAESFGLPSVAATFKWAIVQAVEQARYLLIPIGKQVGPGNTAARTPAHQIQQATTYRPGPDSSPQASEKPSAWSRAVLWLYDRIQHIWKTLQWLVLTPTALFVVLVMSVVRLLILVPFLRPGVIATISGVFDYIMLHWIASTEIYMLEATRASAIRGRFVKALKQFLDDPLCDRIVVIGHSMGTVIAYEGLTSALEKVHPRAQPLESGDEPPLPKDITFICLAQAFRRVWLLSAADPHRVRDVLSNGVRWLLFWARYDPVAAGPLNRESLPPIKNWPDPREL